MSKKILKWSGVYLVGLGGIALLVIEYIYKSTPSIHATPGMGDFGIFIIFLSIPLPLLSLGFILLFSRGLIQLVKKEKFTQTDSILLFSSLLFIIVVLGAFLNQNILGLLLSAFF